PPDARADEGAPRADRQGAGAGRGARGPTGAAAHAGGDLPRADRRRRMRLLLHQLRNEQRLYWRSHELAFFAFLFPVLIFVLLGSVYGNDKISKEHVKGSHYLLAGMLGYGLASTAFAGLAIIVVIRRESAILKRLRGTPLPAWAYIAATVISAIIVFAIEVVVLLVLARVLFDVPFPSRIFSLVLGLLLGSIAFSAMAIGLTTVIRSAEASSASVNAVYLPM